MNEKPLNPEILQNLGRMVQTLRDFDTKGCMPVDDRLIQLAGKIVAQNDADKAIDSLGLSAKLKVSDVAVDTTGMNYAHELMAGFRKSQSKDGIALG